MKNPVLKNHALCLARFESEQGCVVLAAYPDKMEFVTWKLDDDGNAYWGHYFSMDAYAEAIEDFRKRVAGLMPKI